MKPMLLIDTASPQSTVALQAAGEISSLSTDEKRQAAQQILPLLDQVLGASNFSLLDLSAIAVISGPGSFTGMRIGVGVAQGLASASNIPVIAISTLAAQAASAVAQTGIQRWVVALPAREEEFYAAAYEIDSHGDAQPVHDDCIASREEIADLLARLCQAGPTGLAANSLMVDALSADEQCQKCKHWLTDLELDLKAVLTLAQARLAAGAASAPEQALPNYVKETLEY